jgi:hypothetical protein
MPDHKLPKTESRRQSWTPYAIGINRAQLLDKYVEILGLKHLAQTNIERMTGPTAISVYAAHKSSCR